MTTSPVRSHCPDQASTVGITKEFQFPQRYHLARSPTHQQTSHMSSAATPPQMLRAKWRKGEPLQDFQARQENYSPELQYIYIDIDNFSF